MKVVQLIGRIVDRKYNLVRLLGEGGMGSVYEAEHTRINRRVAIKMMHPDTRSEPDAVERFLREAESASAIGHPNIIEIYDVGVEGDGTAYIVMELLDGVSLDVVLKEKGALPPTRAVAIVLQILSALYAAHKKGIIHRDLKPENVFMAVDARNREEVKLLDFGVAKVQEATEDSLRLTKTGTVLGTPSYLSPEQARGRKDIDERIDIWAAGVLLYQMLAGELPFKGESYNEVLANVLIEDPVPLGPRAPGAHEGLIAVVGKAMTKDRDGRFQAVSEMIDALLPYCERAEYEMTPQAFEVLRKSVPPAPALPKVDTGTGMPAIPPASPISGDEIGPAGSGRRDESGEHEIVGGRAAEGRGRPDGETTLDEPIEPAGKSDSLGDSFKWTIKRVLRPGEYGLRLGAAVIQEAVFGRPDAVGKQGGGITGRIKLLTPKQIALSALVGAGLAAMVIGLASMGGGEADLAAVEDLVLEPAVLEPAAPASAGSGVATGAAADWPQAEESEPAAGALLETIAAEIETEPVSAAGQVQPASGKRPTEGEQEATASAGEPEPPLGVEAPSTVAIELRGAPAAAVVTLGGERMKPPLELERTEQAKLLRVTAPGHRPFQRTIKLDRDQIITVRMPRLATAKRPPARPKPKKKPEKMLLSNPFK